MKNITESLWKILDSRREDEIFLKICNDIKEANHALKSVICSNNDGDSQNIKTLPWLLTKQQSKDVKEVIEKIKFPIGFCSNMKNILTKKGELGGEKTHGWHTFIKVIICLCIYLYIGET